MGLFTRIRDSLKKFSEVIFITARVFLVLVIVAVAYGLVQLYFKNVDNPASDKASKDLISGLAVNLLASTISGAVALFFVSQMLRDHDEKRKKEHADNIALQTLELIVTEPFGHSRYGKFLAQVMEKAHQQERSLLVPAIVDQVSIDKFLGVRGIVPRLNLEWISSILLDAKSIILVDTYIGGETFRNIERSLIGAIAKGAKVSFYLLDPLSPVVERRRIDLLGRDVRALIMNTLRSIERLHKHCLQSTGTSPAESPISVYCYDSIPGVQIYSTDQNASLGFYLLGTETTQGPQIQIDARSKLWQEIEEHLDFMKKLPTLISVPVGGPQSIEQFFQARRPQKFHELATAMATFSSHDESLFVTSFAKLMEKFSAQDKENFKQKILRVNAGIKRII